MKKSKAFLSAALAAALAITAAAPAAATPAAAPSQAAAPAQTSGADASTFSWDNATVYFLLTDRFKNGDTSNDGAYNRQKTVGGDSRATFHGGDFAGITQEIEAGYFDDLGVNAIWLTAPYEQIHGYVVGGDGSPSFAHYSYHGYYVLDYTETDAAYGTKEEFKKMVDTAHEHGIRIVMDIVMNHAGYNSLYDMNEYGFGEVSSGWDTYYNDGSNVNNKDYHSYINYDASADAWGRWWGADWIRCGIVGYTEGGGDPKTSSLAGLPDFKTESTASVGLPPLLQTKWSKEGTLAEKQAKYGTSNTVTGYISTWLAEWVREYGVDGFRCDTAKHVDVKEWKQLKDACVTALADWKAANPTKKLDDLPFWMTGEHWDHNVGYGVDEYFTSGAFDSMINFETQGGGLLDGSKLASLYQGYADSINTKDNFNALSYISSHDSTLARGDLYHLGSALLMLPGGVQIYYGDETNRPLVSGIPNDGNGGAGHSLRSDMNWDSIDQGVLEHWQKVGTFRNNHVAVGGGANVGLTATSGVAFGRTYSKNGVTDKIAAVVDAAANSDVTIDVSGVFEDGVTLMNTYDESTDTVSGGKVTFNSGAHGTILLEQGEEDPVKVSVKGTTPFETTTDLAVTIEGIDSAKMTIDGFKTLTVKNGDSVTIGNEVYPGDTVVVEVEYKHPVKGDVKKTFKYTKKSDGSSSSRSDQAIVHVKTSLSGACIYSWQGDGDTATQLVGAWPGKTLSTKDDDGWFVENLSTTTDAYNIIINQGSGGAQSGDITGLKGETWVIADSVESVKTYTDKKEAYKAAGIDVPDSDFTNLKNVCKEFKYLNAASYDSDAYAAVQSKVADADALIAQGEDKADAAAVTAAYKNVSDALTALKAGEKPLPDSDTEQKPDSDTEQKPDSDTEQKPDSDTEQKPDSDTEQKPDSDTEQKPDSDTEQKPDSDTEQKPDSDTEEKPPVPAGKGDINGDGKVSLRDASMAQKHSVGLIELTDDQISAGDMNDDGKVTLIDAYAIQSNVNRMFVK